MTKRIVHLRFYLTTALAFVMFWVIVETVKRPETFFWRVLNEAWRELYLVPVIYFFYEYTLQKIGRKRIVRSLLLIILQGMLLSIGLYGWRQFGDVLNIYTPFMIYPSCAAGVGEQFGGGIFAMLFFGVCRHGYNYYHLKLTAQRLRIEKQEAELNYLKSQTNPHFLFNTLNNIYSLSRDKSDLAPESILRLSKILRFMLYETTGAYIAVEKELKIIKDYIELEKLRYDDSLIVNFSYDIEDMSQSLPPLLLIPLVENAFKHGVSETRHRPFVDIHLGIKHRKLSLVIKNSAEGIREEEEVKENIGLSNVRRQLELQYTDYRLSVKQGKNQFSAILDINLDSHV